MAPHEDLAFAAFREYQSARELEGQHDLARYHLSEISDPFHQFEAVEMTVSHLYREPHPVLDGKSYGARMAQGLLESGEIRSGSRILEVGCGTGIFGREFLRELKQASSSLYKSISYTFFDISPALSQSQQEINREHLPLVSFRTGNAFTASFEEAAYDLIISNEMIADLPVVKLKKGEPPHGNAEAEAWRMAGEFGLDFSDAPPEFTVNIGALRFLSSLNRALKKGGKAYVIEYGSPHGYPVAYHVTDHTEYSIHMGHMMSAADRLGMGPDLRPLPEFLRFQEHVDVLEDIIHAALFQHLLPLIGVEAESSRVYTQDMLTEALPDIIPKTANLQFVPIESQGGIVYPKAFYALTLSKGGPTYCR